MDGTFIVWLAHNLWNRKTHFQILQHHLSFIVFFLSRGLCTTSGLAKDDSWISKLLVRKIEPTKESHSRMLSDKEVIYALNTHNVRPDSKPKYLEN